MITQFTILIIGFSVLSAGLLIIAYLFFLFDMHKSVVSKSACVALLGGLLGLQLAHYQFMAHGLDLLNTRSYGMLLLMVPPAFFFFSRAVLFPESKVSPRDLPHLFPLPIGGLFVPLTLVPSLAFFIGTGYTLWIGRQIIGLKVQRSRFKFELFFGGLFVIFAIAALFLGLSLPYIDARIFYIAYANFIGISFFLVVAALIVFPELLSDISDIAEHAYARSKLAGVDIDAVALSLESAMQDVFQNENLNLEVLAEMLGLSSHQLSELINTKFGCGFSRYVREKRIEVAKKILLDEPHISILAVSMMVGFKSQSNFYAGFREITGESPGHFRKSAGAG